MSKSTRITKGLILVVRRESIDDFKQIARRVSKLDPSIGVVGYPSAIAHKAIPPLFKHIPFLTIYLVNPPAAETTMNNVLAVKGMSKLAEFEHFRKSNIPCLPIEEFRWGMELNSEVYGDWVILKPQNIQSTGKDVNMVPTHAISQLKPSDFPDNHFIHKDGYYVQKMIKSGRTPTHFRVLVFLDEVLYSRVSTSNIPFPDSDNLQVLLSTSVASNFEDRQVDFFFDDKIIEFALKVAKTFDGCPLFGIDIIRDESDGNLFVLETNIGGNVWHFSSAHSQKKHTKEELYNLRKGMITQYNAWDRAAEALVRQVNKLSNTSA